MKTYPAYKPSGIEWIGEIPEHWEVKRLKFVADSNPSNVDKKSVEGEKPVLLCNYVDVYKNEFITSDLPFMVATASKEQIEKFSLRKGDVIATKDSEDPNDIAVPALVKEDMENVICGYHLTHIRPNKEILSGAFLFRVFQSNKFNKQFTIKANGVTRYGLPVSAFTDACLYLPPLPEQTAIAAYLDAKTGQIDRFIAAKQKLIALLKEERTGIINQAVTKGLNPNVPMKPSGIEWLGDIPAHWEVKKLKYVVKAIRTGSTPPSERKEFYEPPTLNWFTPGDFSEEIILEDSKRKVSSLAFEQRIVEEYPPLTVLMVGIGATLGKIGFVNKPSSSNQQINAIIFKDEFNPLFGAYFLRSQSLNIVSLANAATLAILNQSQTKDLPMVVPPSLEQTKIVEFIQTETTKIDTTISKIEKEIELMQEYRTALINEVVTGKVFVV